MFKRLFGTSQTSTLIESAFNDVSTMLVQGASMYDLAVAAVLENQPLTADLDALDDVVDDSERMVRRTVLEHLSLQPEKELVPSLVLISIIQDAERIGDFARGLGEMLELTERERSGPFRDRLLALSKRVRKLFDECERSFREDDVEGAAWVVSEATSIKGELIAYTSEVAGSDLGADQAVVYATTGRILRRIAAHLSNICSSVTQPFDRIRHGDEDV